MTPAPRYDVAIIGAGIAGLAASVLLRNAGLSVICLDGQAHPHRKVGESLDWSSPRLLGRVGIDVDALIADEIATPKKNIVVCELGKEAWTATPPPAIRRRPLRFETVTLHVDRAALDARLFDHASALGTAFIWERVTSVDTAGERVTGCSTAAGRRVEARWYIDASGTARVLSRAMAIPIVGYGRPKVCLWTYFDTPPLYDGTAFFIDNRDAYLSWVWDIPISPRRTSVGFVLPAETLRARRRDGTPVETILREELVRYPRFRGLLEEQPALEVESTSFQAYVTARVCGSNWLMIGEAASMPDPLTGNGLTSGMRHARHAVDAILAAGAADDLDLPAAPRLQPARLPPRSRVQRAHRERDLSAPAALGPGLPHRDVRLHVLRLFHERPARAHRAARTVAMTVFGVLFAGARAWIGGWTLMARTALGFVVPRPVR